MFPGVEAFDLGAAMSRRRAPTLHGVEATPSESYSLREHEKAGWFFLDNTGTSVIALIA